MPALSENTAVPPSEPDPTGWQVDKTTVGAAFRTTGFLDRVLDQRSQLLNTASGSNICRRGPPPEQLGASGQLPGD